MTAEIVREGSMGELSMAEAGGGPKALDAGQASLRLSLILVCSLVYFLDGIVHSIVGPLAPDIAATLRLSHADLGPIFSANLIGQCAGLIIFPLLAARLGHRRIVLCTLVGFGLFEALSAASSTAAELFAARLMTGAFLGGCLPSCLSIVTASAPPERRGIAIMILFTGYGLGATMSGVVAEMFSGLGGWRAASVAVGGSCLIFAAIAGLWLIEPVKRDEANTQATRSIGNGALAIVSPGYLLGTLMLWMLFISMLTISYCLSSWLPILLVEVGRENWVATMSVSIFSFGGIIAALGVGILIDRFGATPVLTTFLTIAAILMFLIGKLLASAPTTILLVLLAICGFFFLGAYGGVNVVLASYYPDHLRAVGIGWTKSVGRVGTVIAPILIGFGLSAGVSETTIMSLFSVPASLSVLALVVIAVAGSRSREAARAVVSSGN
ncbi:MFS transporter [Sphingobium lignivorans]|uniref:MFS family permease n=1 Tax=Sphingobium lignivorans TaxID=2735886 RepID=A0ABR6NH22_9SPHN|nr:MFS transporter [Sphingobium lignivorans]MBB5985479.1 MFS family permease [Sphingobium lignivorans]